MHQRDLHASEAGHLHLQHADTRLIVQSYISQIENGMMDIIDIDGMIKANDSIVHYYRLLLLLAYESPDYMNLLRISGAPKLQDY